MSLSIDSCYDYDEWIGAGDDYDPDEHDGLTKEEVMEELAIERSRQRWEDNEDRYN